MHPGHRRWAGLHAGQGHDNFTDLRGARTFDKHFTDGLIQFDLPATIALKDQAREAPVGARHR